MKDVLFDIEEMYYGGISNAEIASQLGVTLDFVQAAVDSLLEQQDDEYDPFLTDAEADADALASVGWGTDEDYGAYDGPE
jgi:hypothetical protein